MLERDSARASRISITEYGVRFTWLVGYRSFRAGTWKASPKFASNNTLKRQCVPCLLGRNLPGMLTQAESSQRRPGAGALASVCLKVGPPRMAGFGDILFWLAIL